MKNKTGAFALNFLLPGAGFAYLRRWKLAAINLGGALAFGAVLALVMPESFWDGIGGYIGYAVGGASGAWAGQVAEQMNAEVIESETLVPTMDELSDQARIS